MRVSRILFDDSEPTDSIARRIACAFDPGNVIRIRDSYYKMSSLKVMNQTVEGNIIGDNYTLILNPGEPIPENLLKAPPPPPPQVVSKPPELDDTELEDDDDEAPVLESEPVSEQTTDPEPIEGAPSEPVASVVESQEPQPFPESVPPPPTSEVLLSRPPPPPTNDNRASSESGEFRLELPKQGAQSKVEVGQVWQSKDTRRRTDPFVVVNVDSEFVYQDNGRKIALSRMIRYKRVS